MLVLTAHLKLQSACALCLSAAILVLAGPSLRAQEQASAEQNQYFEQHIRPLLIEHCLDCHSNDTEASGGLVLDSRIGWQTGGDLGPAIVPEEPNASLFMKVIQYTDPDLQMPPDGKLPEEAIEKFSLWIAQGAFDPREGSLTKEHSTALTVERAQEHWAYRPLDLQDETLPNGSSDSPIDSFIEDRLIAEGIAPAPSASPEALVRRLYFDLIGLPPPPEKLRAFRNANADSLEQLYQDCVDELLGSPRYGEHLARKWMDVVRYADSITLRGFVLPNAWRYRDYLIDAYNEDRSFATMIQEQVAGDLMAADLVESGTGSLEEIQKHQVATGFMVLGNTNLERQDKQQLEMDYIDEQLEVLGRAFLGQTIGCARCHDHKFDPIPTADYYAMAGILRSAVALKHSNVSAWIDQPLQLDTEQQDYFTSLQSRRKKLNAEISELQAMLDGNNSDKVIQLSDLAGIVLDSEVAKQVGKWRNSQFSKPYIESGYLVAETPAVDSTLTFEPENLPPGTYEVRIAFPAFDNRASNARISVFGAEGEKNFRVNQRKRPPNSPWYSLGQHRFEKNGQAYVLVSNADANGVVIADAVQFLPVDDPDGETSAPSTESTLSSDEKLKAELAAIKQAKKKIDQKLAGMPKYITLYEGKDAQDIAIHIRGDVHSLGEVVPRGFLTALNTQASSEFGKTEGPSRLDLARWLSCDQNPLTARVYANRVWSWLMGQGLVPSINNFGTTGVDPTHAELLDWLARDLIRENWSTKSLVRRIVLSKAYRRALVEPSPQAVQTDPANQLYWRGHARRLSAEQLRDAMLCISGELNLTMHGSLIQPGTKEDYNYQHVTTRRSVYHPVFRNSLPELFEVFDFADPSVSVGQRPRSTVAPQALALANHPWVRQRAEATCRQFLDGNASSTTPATPQSTESQLAFLYEAMLGRLPNSSEQELGHQWLSRYPRDSLEYETQLTDLIQVIYASLDFRYLD